jgi:hypothetical protein
MFYFCKKRHRRFKSMIPGGGAAKIIYLGIIDSYSDVKIGADVYKIRAECQKT